MANSDYSIKAAVSGFCPSANLLFTIGHLDADATMLNYRSPVPNGIRVGMAALIDSEIVSVLSRSGNNLTLGRGCCDTIPSSHLAGAKIWFFDDSIGNEGTEYGATEVVSAKVLPRTASGGAVPVAYAPPNGVTFNWRFDRPYPPGLLLVNGSPWFNSFTLSAGIPSLTASWAHRDRITQMDQLIDHSFGSVGPEANTAYLFEVRRTDNSLVRSQELIGRELVYTRSDAMSDFAVSSGVHTGYIIVSSKRSGQKSLQNYRINFTLNAA